MGEEVAGDVGEILEGLVEVRAEPARGERESTIGDAHPWVRIHVAVHVPDQHVDRGGVVDEVGFNPREQHVELVHGHVGVEVHREQVERAKWPITLQTNNTTRFHVHEYTGLEVRCEELFVHGYQNPACGTASNS